MKDILTGKPYMNVMFGNFYCPAYDDEAFIDETMRRIREWGFNSVMFDTKAWEDFRERYETGELSQYVKMQEYMGKSALEHGLTYAFLVLYLNGDNLYPHIRFSPPIFGEEVVYLDGRPGHWYKYWSAAARQSMKDHVERIMESYRFGCTTCVVGQKEKSEPAGLPALPVEGGSDEKTVLPVCSMWDPIVAPSFDEEGITRYRRFLKKYYHDDIKAFNAAYQTKAASFETITPQEYWFSVRYDSSYASLATRDAKEESNPFFSEDDVKNKTPRFVVWHDNAVWKMQEMVNYFQSMQTLLKEKNPDLYLCPDMTQWGYFLNIDGRHQCDHDNDYSDLWDTALRGIDIYALAPYVDCCHFITVPTTPDAYPNAYVTSCQHSMMRVMNEGREWIGGTYWGRYIYNDLFSQVTPAEIIGTMVACGIDGYTCYGINGLDDGGVLNRMDPDFLDSLTVGNNWCAKVIPQRKGARKKEIALLFPAEMAHYEPYEVENNKIRRLDLLGWYGICCDLGYQVDVISFHEIEAGRLDDYRILIVPANDCYHVDPHDEMEEIVRKWTGHGGILLHGPGDGLARNCFGIEGEPCKKLPYRCQSVIIPQGSEFCRYTHGQSVVDYVDDGGCCTAVQEIGAGAVYSFGVQIGASYASKNIPHVPYEQNNKEMYPIRQAQSPMIENILKQYLLPAGGICERGIETGVFENGRIIVNHRSTPYILPESAGEYIFQYDLTDRRSGRRILMPHSAVWIASEE